MFIPTADTVLQNISLVIPELMRLVTAIAYVAGLYFVIKGVSLLRHIPTGSHQTTLTKCLVYIGVGTALLYLPGTANVGTSTFFANPSPYAYAQVNDSYTQLYSAVFRIIALVGTIALIRGLILFTHTPSQNEHHPFIKASTFCVSGVLCINMQAFLMTVFTTLGLTGFLF